MIYTPTDYAAKWKEKKKKFADTKRLKIEHVTNELELLIIRDLNAKVRKRSDEAMEQYVETTENSRKLIDTFSKQKRIHKYTWEILKLNQKSISRWIVYGVRC